YSERYAQLAGGARSDEADNALLPRELAGRRHRRARNVAVVPLVRQPDGPQPLIAQCELHGAFLDAPRCTGGFAYDPLFWFPAMQRSVAELDPQEKNRISHRALALRELLARLGA